MDKLSAKQIDTLIQALDLLRVEYHDEYDGDVDIGLDPEWRSLCELAEKLGSARNKVQSSLMK